MPTRAPLASAAKYYGAQQALTALAVRHVGATSTDLARSLRLIAVYQANAALLALQWGSQALAEQDVDSSGVHVVPQAFTVVPDAPSVLDDVTTRTEFDRIVSSLVADAGRSAMGVFSASRREPIGHLRQLTAPSCARCAILAGRWYRWSDGFQRHPHCDCVMVPSPRSAGLYDPHKAFERGEVQGLTQAQTKAIADGADINQVVNAARGMQTINFAGRRIQVTLEGTTSRGLAFGSLSARGTTTRGYLKGGRPISRNVASAPRLSPEAIYRVSNNDRDTALRLLRANGYIT